MHLNTKINTLKTNTMNQELKNDLIASWNEAEELLTSFNELSNEELIQCKNAIICRVNNIKHWLEKYVSDEDIIEML